MKWVVTMFLDVFLCLMSFVLVRTELACSKTAACVCLLLALRSTHGVPEWQNLPPCFQYLQVICTFLDGAVKATRATCEVGKCSEVSLFLCFKVSPSVTFVLLLSYCCIYQSCS